MSVDLKNQVAGLDALESAPARRAGRLLRIWSSLWPKAAALAIALAIWQVVVWTGWRPEYLLPGPVEVFGELWKEMSGNSTVDFWNALLVTGRRALVGFAVATAIGLAVGIAVARSRLLRTAVGSLITGLQTMPSIAWFPLAILLFQLTEQAIFFVVVLGAAPSIANGVLNGVDFVPPLLVRAGRNLGAKGIGLYWHVIGPASLPAIVAGLKQGWAFSWRSLMAGELIVIIANRPSIGVHLAHAREFSDAPWLLATMIVILVLGLLADSAFGLANDAIRKRWGLVDASSV